MGGPLTGVDEELVGDPRVVHVMNGSCKEGGKNLQVREHSLGAESQGRREMGEKDGGVGEIRERWECHKRRGSGERDKDQKEEQDRRGTEVRDPGAERPTGVGRWAMREMGVWGCAGGGLTSSAGVASSTCVDCSTSAACRLLW